MRSDSEPLRSPRRDESISISSKRKNKYDYNRNESISESDEDASYTENDDEYNEVLHKYGMHRDENRYRSERFSNIYIYNLI